MKGMMMMKSTQNGEKYIEFPQRKRRKLIKYRERETLASTSTENMNFPMVDAVNVAINRVNG